LTNRSELAGLEVVPELAVALRLLDARAVHGHELLLPFLDPALETRIGPDAPDELQVDAEPGRIELEHLPHQCLEPWLTRSSESRALSWTASSTNSSSLEGKNQTVRRRSRGRLRA
jgi:hypothetical protein